MDFGQKQNLSFKLLLNGLRVIFKLHRCAWISNLSFSLFKSSCKSNAIWWSSNYVETWSWKKNIYGISCFCLIFCSRYSYNLQLISTSLFARLHERLQECNGDEILKAEASAKVQKFTEWALKCIGFHSRQQDNKDSVIHNSAVEIQLQLSAFKTFLDLAGNHLTGKDFTEAFDAACFPLTLFSSSFDSGWASGISATVIQGLLGMLVEGGADNVNQCFLEASRFGSTELVRILLQVSCLLEFSLTLFTSILN